MSCLLSTRRWCSTLSAGAQYLHIPQAIQWSRHHHQHRHWTLEKNKVSQGCSLCCVSYLKLKLLLFDLLLIVVDLSWICRTNFHNKSKQLEFEVKPIGYWCQVYVGQSRCGVVGREAVATPEGLYRQYIMKPWSSTLASVILGYTITHGLVFFNSGFRPMWCPSPWHWCVPSTCHFIACFPLPRLWNNLSHALWHSDILQTKFRREHSYFGFSETRRISDLFQCAVHKCIISSAGWAFHISWWRCCLCVYVCLDINQSGTNRNRYTQRLLILHAPQTY